MKLQEQMIQTNTPLVGISQKDTFMRVSYCTARVQIFTRQSDRFIVLLLLSSSCPQSTLCVLRPIFVK